MEIEDGAGLPSSHVSIVCNVYLVASTVVCVCFVCYYNLCFVSMYVFSMDLKKN